jgi:hypothetical protein
MPRKQQYAACPGAARPGRHDRRKGMRAAKAPQARQIADANYLIFRAQADSAAGRQSGQRGLRFSRNAVMPSCAAAVWDESAMT